MAYMLINALISETGMVTNMIRLDFHSRKNINTTNVTNIKAYQMDEVRLLTDSVTISSVLMIS
ncbi:hypothetical protein SDC9_120633 [bioreactor metagenome]|uniref:Uncharacterized protein n=1 Tax=bioreactor metagenome TaxID=1076179 RepID=A0A645C8E3_9ZZZZ